jgi:hypothetical protein
MRVQLNDVELKYCRIFQESSDRLARDYADPLQLRCCIEYLDRVRDLDSPGTFAENHSGEFGAQRCCVSCILGPAQSTEFDLRHRVRRPLRDFGIEAISRIARAGSAEAETWDPINTASVPAAAALAIDCADE